MDVYHAMIPGQEYTAKILAKVCQCGETHVRGQLRSLEHGGLVTGFKKKGVRGRVFRTNQLRLPT